MANFIIQYHRRVFLVVLSIHLLVALQRLVFDFLGYIWLLVILGIAELIFIIVGLFGGYQQRAKYLLTFAVWSVFWILLNIVVMILYIGVGSFTHDNNWLSFNQKNSSWYAEHGIGCKLEKEPHSLQKVPKGCALNFKYVEIIQASLQVLLGVIGFILAIGLRKKVIIAKDVYVVGRVNPYASYVKSNQAAQVSRSRPAIITTYN
ncbi:sodium/potassium-transporting ATPase subunit beta-1-interacting protein 3-like [Rhopilema esculentum]|uniref:sodium/potassium-transporting ATPase subunit beta-1-interacting protein 3-like n=1 Tax=Rhopilema esculentum TaxID=499914 RepID=UPI0031E0BE56